jgi:cold shock CspA family protein
MQEHTMNGTITALHTGGQAGGYGYIAPDEAAGPWKLLFRHSAVAEDGFARLRKGQRVRFDHEPLPGNPSRQHAVGVAPLD